MGQMTDANNVKAKKISGVVGTNNAKVGALQDAYTTEELLSKADRLAKNSNSEGQRPKVGALQDEYTTEQIRSKAREIGRNKKAKRLGAPPPPPSDGSLLG